jgi:hypothetical protein
LDPVTLGCLFAVGRSFRLDAGQASTGRPFALAGSYAAHRRRDGSTRHRVVNVFDHEGVTGINRRQATLPSLVLNRNGSAGWIAMVPWSYLRDVYRVDARGVKLLDRDAQIRRHSLRLHDGRLSWIRDGATRTASLR